MDLGQPYADLGPNPMEKETLQSNLGMACQDFALRYLISKLCHCGTSSEY